MTDPAPAPDTDAPLSADDPALLAQMGFAAFGTPPRDRAGPAAKKRRPNPARAELSGANATSANRQPLGARGAPADARVVPNDGRTGAATAPPPADASPDVAMADDADATADASLGTHAEPRNGAGEGALRPVRVEDRSAAEWAALRSGVRDEHGDVAYFDWSFVEDPWAGPGGRGRG